ncbi:MAG: beta-galactosidase [Lentisphaeria bacterium]|nr:beta-galactosidase [Lentisphaeria bacterium]NQZ68622.1 beta-galactosidase [Lentisphaeria bacterium]
MTAKKSKRHSGSILGSRNGRPLVIADGKPTSQAIYCDYILRGDWDARVKRFVDSGVKTFHLNEPHGPEGNGTDFFDQAMWIDDGVFPKNDHAYAYNLDYQATTILSMQPDAQFYIKFNLSPPIGWTKNYPDEMQTDENGKTYREASWSSKRYLNDLTRHINTIIDCVEGSGWGEHIIGYMALPYGEGLTQTSIADFLFEHSTCNTESFRKWLKKKYRTQINLRDAWGNKRVTFNSVKIPSDKAWKEKRSSGTPTFKGEPVSAMSLPSNCQQESIGLFHWIEPGNAAAEIDYFMFMQDVFQNWILTVTNAVKDRCRKKWKRERVLTLDITKQPLLGWQIQSNFDGIGDGHSANNILLASGSWGVDKLLDDPSFDGAWTPADYTARTLGFAYECEGLSDTWALRNKTMMLEDDTRCYVGVGIQDQGAFRTPKEVEAGLLRNIALPFSRGFQFYWCNIGSSFYHDDKIQKTVTRYTRMIDSMRTWPHKETEDAIAFVIDDESCIYEDFTSGFQSLSVIWQRVRGLAHCGIPYRIFLLSDLKKDIPNYKTWIFPNLFKVDSKTIKLLKKKVLRKGNVAIFGPGTGITDGNYLGAEQATKLLGVDMEIHLRTTVRHVVVYDLNGHPISKELPANMVYGDSMPYGPTITPKENAVENCPTASVLGHANACWFIHRTGLFINEFGKGARANGKTGGRGENDYAVVWSHAIPLPSELIRSCARYAGSTVWCEENDVIYASDSLVSIHSMKAGKRRINLSRPRKVTDAVTGKAYSNRKVKVIDIRVTPPCTRLFLLD